jgi:hypothetical protein
VWCIGRSIKGEQFRPFFLPTPNSIQCSLLPYQVLKVVEAVEKYDGITPPEIHMFC